MGLLPFLRAFHRASLNQIINNAVTAILLPLYLEGMAKKIVSQRLGQYDVDRNPYARTFLHLVHNLNQRFLSNDIQDPASKRVTETSQEKEETEDNFCDRIIEWFYQCAKVFRDRRVVEEYLRRITSEISRVVMEKLKTAKTLR